MSSYKALVLLAIAAPALAGEGFVVGTGIESDSSDGFAVAALGEYAITETTWLSGLIARNTVDQEGSTEIDSWLGSVGLDHWFEPVGMRVGLSYWGDSDSLDSTDYSGSLYWRNKQFYISGEYEYRDFDIDLPAVDFLVARRASFDADGFGLTTRFDITDDVDLRLSGMDYDYSIDLRLDDTQRPLLELLVFSRLSLINSLVDYRASASLGVDFGDHRVEFDVGKSKGEVDGGETISTTLRFLNPIGNRADIEFALGRDDSDLYGDVTFLSIFVFFYGGG